MSTRRTRTETKTLDPRESILEGIRVDFNRVAELGTKWFQNSDSFRLRFCDAYMNWRDTFAGVVFKNKAIEREEKSQVSFIRALVPDLKPDRDLYRIDPRYKAAQYLFQTGFTLLRKEALTAKEAHTATPRQEAILALSKPRHKKDTTTPSASATPEAPKAEVTPKANGQIIPSTIWLTAYGLLDIAPSDLEDVFLEAGLAKPLVAALMAEYKVICDKLDAADAVAAANKAATTEVRQ